MVGISIFILQISCTHQYSNIDTKSKNIEAQLVISLTKKIADAIPQATAASGNCSVASPSFSTLKNAGIELSCGSCHNDTLLRGGLSVTSYNSVKNVTESTDPNAATIYRNVLPNAKMYSNTTQAINEALYCWIKGGANP